MNCSRCDRVNLTVKDFYTTSGGGLFSYCKICHNKRSAKNKKISRQKPENKLKDSKKKKLKRSDPQRRPNVIFTDSKASDKKFGREFDLTVDFIRTTISSGCAYCGESELQMTLDRLNNNIGHLQLNVVAACIRCNLIRKAMPYEAWMCLVAGIREAREKGLFNSWSGR